jgi:protein tyrosine/serine phosphatase
MVKTAAPSEAPPTRRWRRRLIAVLVVPLVALLAYAGYTFFEANLHSVVSGEAYRSGQMNANELAHTIQKYSIKSVLNLRGENLTTDWYQEEIATSAKLKVVHYDRSLGSGTALTLEQMDDLVTLLRLAPKPILIHCLGGADRSGLVSALYRLAIAGQAPDLADRELTIWYGHVPLIRPKVTAMDDSFWLFVSNRVSHAAINFQPTPVSP